MGSLISTTSEPSPPTITNPLHIPLDILLEIISHLNPDRDQTTLLSTAVCCRNLRNASQRILFSSFRRDRMDEEETWCFLSAHIGFLNTIANSPRRLALFVRSYSQVGLALEPRFRNDRDAQTKNKNLRIMLWYSTAKALPLMTNLKHLSFKPARDHSYCPSLLHNCRFTLESFRWEGKGNEERLYKEFLPKQPDLLHLDINSCDSDATKLLPENLCPSLVSVACPFSALGRIAESRPIVAVQIRDEIWDLQMHPVHVEQRSPEERQQYLKALKRLKYICLRSLSDFQPLTIGISLTSVVVLRVHINGNAKELNMLATQFPRLRILRLWKSYLSEADASIGNKAAREAFGHCPVLESVMLSTITGARNNLGWLYSMGEGGGLKQEVMDGYVEKFDCEIWWKT